MRQQRQLVSLLILLAVLVNALPARAAKTMLVFTSGHTATNSATTWLGNGNTLNGATESSILPIQVVGGTIKNLWCKTLANYAGSGNWAPVVRDCSAYGTCVSTTLTCTINSTNTNTCSDTTHSATVTALHLLDIQFTDNSIATNVTPVCFLELDPQ